MINLEHLRQHLLEEQKLVAASISVFERLAKAERRKSPYHRAPVKRTAPQDADPPQTD